VFIRRIRKNYETAWISRFRYPSLRIDNADDPLVTLNEKIDWEKRGDRTRAKTRSRIKHIFVVQVQRAGNAILRCISFVRATATISLRYLAYNLSRYSLPVTLHGWSAPCGQISLHIGLKNLIWKRNMSFNKYQNSFFEIPFRIFHLWKLNGWIFKVSTSLLLNTWPTSFSIWIFHLISLLPIRRIGCRYHVHAKHLGNFYQTLNLREEGDLVDSNLYRNFGIFLSA